MSHAHSTRRPALAAATAAALLLGAQAGATEAPDEAVAALPASDVPMATTEAAPSAGLPFYVALMGSTTLSARPAGGPRTLGPQKDIAPGVGLGVILRDVFFLELDLSSTYVGGELGPLTLVPGVSYAFHPNAYAAARFAVPVQSQPTFTAIGGVGVFAALTPRLSPMLEVDVLATPHGSSGPDLALSASLGLIISL